MITTITGNNSFLVARKLNELSVKFAQKYGDWSVEKLDGEDSEIGRINESLQNLPFLMARKLVILRDPSKNKQFAENIEQIISSIPDTTETVIVESKIDKRQNYFKTLKAKTEFSELNDLDQYVLSDWLMKYVAQNGGKVSPAAIKYLVERAGTSQELLFNEINKLIAYKPEVTEQAIDLLTERSPQNTVFDLLDAAFSADGKKVLALYDDQRRQRVEPLAIMAMITWQLHIIATIKTAGKRSVDEIAREAKLNPFVVRKSYSVAHKLSLAEIKNLVSRALKLDISLKSQSIDPDEALKHFLLSIGEGITS